MGRSWSGLGAGLTHTHPAPISSILLSPVAPSPSHTRTLGQGPDLPPGLLNLPGKKRLPGFHFPEGLPPEPPPWFLITPGGREVTGLLNKLSPDPLGKAGSSRPSHPSYLGRLLTAAHDVPLAPLGCSPRCARVPASPAEPSPATRTFALSQPLFQLLSLLVNIDLHIRLNIDIRTKNPFPAKASNTGTATWNPRRCGSHLSPEKGGSGDGR